MISELFDSLELYPSSIIFFFILCISFIFANYFLRQNDLKFKHCNREVNYELYFLLLWKRWRTEEHLEQSNLFQVRHSLEHETHTLFCLWVYSSKRDAKITDFSRCIELHLCNTKRNEILSSIVFTSFLYIACSFLVSLLINI